MTANPQAEIRRGGRTLNVDPIEQAIELALRRKNAAKTADGGEIGVRKSVDAVKRGEAGFVALPRTELPVAVDLAYGNRIRQRGLVSHRSAETGVLQPQSTNRKDMRGLAGILHQHVEFRAVGHNFIHDNSVRRRLLFAPHGVEIILSANFRRRHGDFKAFQRDLVHVAGPPEKLPKRYFRRKAVDTDEGRNILPAMKTNHEVFAAKNDPGIDEDIESTDVDITGKMFAERAERPRPHITREPRRHFLGDNDAAEAHDEKRPADD